MTNSGPFSIIIDSKPVAALLIELVTKAAVPGPHAKNLATLYDQAVQCAENFGIKVPPPPET